MALQKAFLSGRLAYLLETGQSVKGVHVAFNEAQYGEAWGPVNHVKDAFTYRKFLVKLAFAQKTFVVSIKNFDAATEEEAVECATQRATLSMLEAGTPLGNLMGAEAFEDTWEKRRTLGVDGERVRTEYMPEWRNAA